MDNLLRADLSLMWRTTELTVGYGPRLSVARWFDGSQPWDANFMHEVDAGFYLRESRYTFGLSQSFSYGTQSFGQAFAIPGGITASPPGTEPGTSPSALAAAATAATPVSPLPRGTGDLVPLRSVQYLGYSSRGAFTYLFSPRWESNFDVSYNVSGGRDSDRAVLPRISTVDIGSAVEYAITRHHGFGGVLHGERGWSDQGDFWLTELAASWAWRFSEYSLFSLRAGISYRNTEDEGSPERTSRVSPVAAAGLTHTIRLEGSRALLGVVVTYDPGVDVISATLQNRLTLLASASWATEDTSVTLALTGSQEFGGDDGRFGGVSLTLDQRLVGWLGMQVGGQVAKQDSGLEDTQLDEVQRGFYTGTIWTVFAGLTATLDPQKF
ncbi:MAG TPA: hypothetical protein VJV78_42495 [Polyangiales bacterium]|nr:hypothetical protein [Polyangiales bacterium]